MGRWRSSSRSPSGTARTFRGGRDVAAARRGARLLARLHQHPRGRGARGARRGARALQPPGGLRSPHPPRGAPGRRLDGAHRGPPGDPRLVRAAPALHRRPAAPRGARAARSAGSPRPSPRRCEAGLAARRAAFAGLHRHPGRARSPRSARSPTPPAPRWISRQVGGRLLALARKALKNHVFPRRAKASRVTLPLVFER